MEKPHPAHNLDRKFKSLRNQRSDSAYEDLFESRGLHDSCAAYRDGPYFHDELF